MYCFKCGNQIPDDSIFCSKCGTKVVNETKPFFDGNIYQVTVEPTNPPQNSEFNCSVRLCKDHRKYVSIDSPTNCPAGCFSAFEVACIIFAIIYSIFPLFAIYIPATANLIFPVYSIVSYIIYLLTTHNKKNRISRFVIFLILFLLFCLYALLSYCHHSNSMPGSILIWLEPLGNSATAVSLVAIFVDLAFNQPSLRSKSNKSNP